MCVEGLVDLFIDIPAHRTYCIVYGYTEEPVVSSDIIGGAHFSIFGASFTQVGGAFYSALIIQVERALPPVGDILDLKPSVLGRLHLYYAIS